MAAAQLSSGDEALQKDVSNRDRCRGAANKVGSGKVRGSMIARATQFHMFFLEAMLAAWS